MTPSCFILLTSLSLSSRLVEIGMAVCGSSSCWRLLTFTLNALNFFALMASVEPICPSESRRKRPAMYHPVERGASVKWKLFLSLVLQLSPSSWKNPTLGKNELGRKREAASFTLLVITNLHLVLKIKIVDFKYIFISNIQLWFKHLWNRFPLLLFLAHFQKKIVTFLTAIIYLMPQI